MKKRKSSSLRRSFNTVNRSIKNQAVRIRNSLTEIEKTLNKIASNEEIKNKKVALFLTCGVPREHYHADDSINNYIAFMEERGNDVIKTFVCQGKIDPKVLIVFKILSWKDPNFIHKVTPDLVDMMKQSKTHPDQKDLYDAGICFKELLETELF